MMREFATMNRTRKSGRINVKAVVILLCVVVLLGVGAFVARKVRRQIIASNALTAAKAALDAEEFLRGFELAPGTRLALPAAAS